MQRTYKLPALLYKKIKQTTAQRHSVIGDGEDWPGKPLSNVAFGQKNEGVRDELHVLGWVRLAGTRRRLERVEFTVRLYELAAHPSHKDLGHVPQRPVCTQLITIQEYSVLGVIYEQPHVDAHDLFQHCLGIRSKEAQHTQKIGNVISTDRVFKGKEP